MAAERVNPYANLPRVVQIIDLEDHGEFGAASCPHCGAEGRYIYRFICEGSPDEIRGAMKGCFAHFPKHPFVAKDQAIREKERECARTGRQLASWDIEIRDAITAYVNGTISETQATQRIRTAEYGRDCYLRRRFGRR